MCILVHVIDTDGTGTLYYMIQMCTLTTSESLAFYSHDLSITIWQSIFHFLLIFVDKEENGRHNFSTSHLSLSSRLFLELITACNRTILQIIPPYYQI